MHIKLLVSAAAIALVAGVGSASADENFSTLDGISAFDSLAGIQAIPLDTEKMASVTAAHFLKMSRKSETGWVVIETGHLSHYVHHYEHGVKLAKKDGGLVESTDAGWSAELDAIHEAHPTDCGLFLC